MSEWDREQDNGPDKAQGSEKNSPVFDNTRSPEVPQAPPADIGQERELPPDPRDGPDLIPQGVSEVEQNQARDQQASSDVQPSEEDP